MSTRNRKHQEYADFAELCLEITKTVVDQQARIALREMAAEWLILADAASLQAAKNNGKGDDSHDASPSITRTAPGATGSVAID